MEKKMINKTHQEEELKTLISNCDKRISDLKVERSKFFSELVDLENKNKERIPIQVIPNSKINVI